MGKKASPVSRTPKTSSKTMKVPFLPGKNAKSRWISANSRQMSHKEVCGWGGRIRTYDLLYQKQLPYH